jgi:hypothetical protein
MYDVISVKEITMNKYQKWYNNIIKNSKERDLQGYYELHHILPRCIGGTNDENNLAKLTSKEHFVCHYLLTKFCNKSHYEKLINSAVFMKARNNRQNRYVNDYLYKVILKKYSKYQSIYMLGENNPFFGKSHSEKSKEMMSNSKSGINNSWNTGLSKTNCQKLKEIGRSISDAVKGMRHWTDGVNETKAFDCPGDGWRIGRAPNQNFKFSEERKKQIKDRCSNGNMSWWNNGTINKRQKEKPNGDEWIKGRIMSKQLYDKFCKKETP